MNVGENLVRNTFWYGIVTVIGLVSGLLMSVVLARGLGPSLMGDYSYLLWASRTFGAIAALGFGVATIRYTADALSKDDAPLAWGFVRLFISRQLVAAAIVALVVAVLAFRFASPGLRWPFVVAGLALFPVTLESIYASSLYGAQRYDLTTRVSTIKMTLHLAAAIAAMWLGAGILGLMVGATIGSMVSCLLQRSRAHRIYPVAARPVPAEARREVRSYVASLSMVTVLEALVWDRSEVFFLGMWVSPHEIAFYSLAFGLASRAMVVPEIVGGALLPTFATLHGSGAPEQFGHVYRTALRYTALAGAVIAGISGALAAPLVTILYGTEYLPAARIFQVLIAVSLLGALRHIAWTALRAVGDRRAALAATWVSAVLNVGLAAALIPWYGTTGAVVANSVAQVLATIWAFVAMTRTHRCPLPVDALTRVAGAGAVALLVTWAVSLHETHLIGLVAAAAAGLAVYVVGCLALRVLATRELATLLVSTRRFLAARPAGA